ncbi:hypothetical protein FS837_006287, partial [Tulasnella sp. UAMH 9824]
MASESVQEQARAENQPLVPRMHTALNVPELLVAIFSWLSKGDLTQVARVSRLLSSLSLDIIWETIPELKYLVSTYRPLTQQGITKEGIRVWKFRDTPDEGFWDVFWAYAGRVRAVEACTGLYTPEVICDLRSQLERSSCGPSLLPNLRSLSLRVLTNDSHPIEALPIIPAGLRTLQVSIELNITPSTVQRLLEHFTTIPLNQLEEVEFSRRGRVDSDASLSLHRATFLQQNRSTLIHLNLAIFPLTTEDLAQLGSFPLTTRLTLVQKGTAMELSNFFDAIASSFPQLQWIDVNLDDAIKEGVPIAIIGGLATCRGLRSISLASLYWRPLTKEDVYQFGLWWPLMEEFSLYQTGPHSSSRPATPFALLQDFAQAWSRPLRKVVLQFDTAAPSPDPSSIMVRFNRLETLWVGSSPLDDRDVEQVVELLKA